MPLQDQVILQLEEMLGVKGIEYDMIHVAFNIPYRKQRYIYTLDKLIDYDRKDLIDDFKVYKIYVDLILDGDKKNDRNKSR